MSKGFCRLMLQWQFEPAASPLYSSATANNSWLFCHLSLMSRTP